MDLVAIDDEERLFVSSAIDDWQKLYSLGIQVVFDLDAPVDEGLPTRAAQLVYVYLPIQDADLPDMEALKAAGRLGATLHRAGRKVLVHCGMGLNRSPLLAGLILFELGWDGEAAVRRLRERRPGALFNEEFEHFLCGLHPAQRDL